METVSALLSLCAGNSPVTGEFHSRRPVTRRFDVFFDVRPNKRLSKQSRRRWFDAPLCSLWRHCNDFARFPQCVETETNRSTFCRRCFEIHFLEYELYFAWNFTELRYRLGLILTQRGQTSYWRHMASEPMLAYNQLGAWEQTSVQLASKHNYTHEKSNICKLAAILFRPQCVKTFLHTIVPRHWHCLFISSWL